MICEARAPWNELVARIASNPRIYPTKKALPWIKLAQFGNVRTGNDSLRHDANVIAISGVEADYDAGLIGLADAATEFATRGVAAFLYSTPSYTPDAPRWRALCPTSRPYPPAERARSFAMIFSTTCQVIGSM